MSILFATGTAYQLVPWPGPTTAMGAFTMAARVYTANITTANQIPLILDGSGGCTTVIQLDTGTTPPSWLGFLTNDAVTVFPGVSGPATITINTWYHVCLTYDLTTITLYVNGVSVGTNTPGALTRTGNWQNWVSPTDWIGSAQDMVGYNAALGPEEVRQLYLARKPKRRTNLLMHAPLFTAPGLGNYAGTGQNLALSGGAPTAGLDTAGVAWGDEQQQPMIKKFASSATLTAAIVETATMLGAAGLSLADLQTAKLAAAAGLSAAQLEQAIMLGAASTIAADRLTAAALGAAALVAGGAATSGMGGATSLSGGILGGATGAAAANLLGAMAQTAGMLIGPAPQSLTANAVQTAKMVAAVSQFLGAGVQSAGAVAVAQLLAAEVQTAQMSAGGGGGGGSGAALRNRTSPARRPLMVLSRRGIRAR